MGKCCALRGREEDSIKPMLRAGLALTSRYYLDLRTELVEIKDEFAEKAALVYEVPITFFTQRDPVYGAPVSVHPMWRRKADVSGRDLDSVVAELNIRVMHLRRFLQGAEVANTNDLPRMDIDEYGSPEKVASLVRAHWRVPAGPLKNLISLVEKAGVMVADFSSRRRVHKRCDLCSFWYGTTHRLEQRPAGRSPAFHARARTRPLDNAQISQSKYGAGGQRICGGIADACLRYPPILRR